MGFKYKKRMTLFLIILLAFTLRIINLNQSLWLDEAINVLATKNFSFLGMISEYAKADFHPPGFFIILWFWTKIFGTSEIVTRIPSVIFGLITIYLIYLVGKKLHSETLGLFAALLLAVNPLHIYYSQEARMYALAALAVLLNIFLLIRLVKKEKVHSIPLILSNLLILSSDYVAYLIFPTQFIFLVILKQKEIIKKWVIAFFTSVLAGIWWIPTFLAQIDVGAVAVTNLPTWKFVVGGFDIKGIPLTLIKFIIGRISYPDKMIYGIILLPIIVIFSFLIWRGIKFISGFGKNLLITWISIPIILATFVSFFVPIYSYFRMLFVLPPFIILTSLGIFSFKPKMNYFFLVIIISIELFSSGIYLFNHSFHREDWRGFVNFMKSKDKNSLVLFESSGTLPPFDYYAHDSLNAKGGLKDFPAKDENSLLDLQNLSQKDIYLVDYLVEITDPNRLVDKSLKKLGYRIAEIKNFHGVGFIYHYVK